MKALLRLSDTPKDFAMGEAPEPQVKSGMVKVKIAYAGLCGSDLHIYLGFESGLPQGIHGHEFSGTVCEVGEGVTNWKAGDRVTVEHTFATCGACEFCKTGRYHLCAKRKSIGFDQQGAFTEYIVVDPQYLHRVPDDVSLTTAAITEPLACCIHGVELCGCKPCQKVLIVGPGPMGLMTGLVFKAYGCHVDMVGMPEDAERLAIAEKAGLNIIEKPASSSYPIAADCSGSNGGVCLAIDALQKGGTLLQVAIATKDLTIPYYNLVYKELKIQATYCHTWKDWDQALKLQKAGLLDLSPVITSCVKLEDWQATFNAALNKEGLKYLFEICPEEE